MNLNSWYEPIIIVNSTSFIRAKKKELRSKSNIENKVYRAKIH